MSQLSLKADGGPQPIDDQWGWKEQTTIMAKHGTKPRPRKPFHRPDPPPAAARRVGVGEILVDAKAALREIAFGTGMQVLQAMLEDGREALCGPRYGRLAERRAYRHGHDVGTVVLGGRKLRAAKPRVSAVGGGEIALPTWAAVTDADPRGGRVLEQALVGVSARQYERSLEPAAAGAETAGTSRSSVSRRLVTRTTRRMREMLERPRDGLDLPVAMIDGTGLGEQLILVALGIDREGRKHVPGVREGATEGAEVCGSLLRELIDRGLPAERARLFVIDGGKGIRKAIRAVFGQWAPIQRCQVHKRRNVREHLPERRRPWVRAAMNRAWAGSDAAAARRSLLRLADRLEEESPGAAGALREGLEETLTPTPLGVSGAIRRTLCSTNAIENLQGTIKRVTRNVKRWRGGKMALRRAVAALCEEESRVHRVRGRRGLPQLIRALEAKARTAALDIVHEVA